MTDWRTIVGNSETLSAADLNGRAITAKIESVTPGRFEEDGETGAPKKTDKKALIAFAGHTKKLAANTINCILIEAMWGKDYENWAGHYLTLAPDVVEVAGKFKGDPCVRVKGSSELKSAITVKIALPRRKPFTRELIPTSRAGASEQIYDTSTGEVDPALVPDDLDARYGATLPSFDDVGPES